MAGEGANRIEVSLARLISISAKLKILLKIAFVLSCVFGIGYLVLVTISFMLPGVFPIELPLGSYEIFPVLFFFLITCCALWIAYCIFGEIANGSTPFSARNAKRIRLVGWILIAEAALELVVSPGFFSLINIQGFDVGFIPQSGITYPVLPINIQALVFAGVCFSLALIFEYGSLLQRLADEII